MKKAITILLAATLMLSLAACGGGNDSNNKPISGDSDTPTTQDDVTNPSDTTPDIQEFTIGETVTTDLVEFTLTRVELSPYLNSTVGSGSSSKIGGNWVYSDWTVNEDFALPTESPTTVDNSLFIAEEGRTFVSFDYTLKFTGKQAVELWNFVPRIDVDFDNGYVFSTSPNNNSPDSGSFWLRTSDERINMGQSGNEISVAYRDGWETPETDRYFTSREIEPLDQTIYLVRGRIDVPVAVAENIDAPLKIIVSLSSTETLDKIHYVDYDDYDEFTYIIR